MNVTNPYAAPQTNQNPIKIPSVYTDSKYLFIKNDFNSPAICIRSGEDVDPNSKKYKVLITHVPIIVYVLIIFGFFGLILLLICQKKVSFEVYLNQENARKYRRNKLVSVSSFLLFIVALVLGFMSGNSYVFILSGAIFLFFLFWAAMTNKLVKLVRYKNKYFQVKNAHSRFLEHMPKL